MDNKYISMVLKSIVLLLILLIPGALIGYIMLLPVLRNLMVIRVYRKRALAKAIEWSDKTKKNPICFMMKCPYCNKEQWVHIKELYTDFRGVKNNHRCSNKKCGLGNAPKRLHSSPKYIEGLYKGFKPKTPGWRSIYYDK